jgi:hypothetical protein
MYEVHRYDANLRWNGALFWRCILYLAASIGISSALQYETH